MKAEISLLIADDHPIFRHGLRQIIESDPQLRIVAEASNGEQVVSLLPNCAASIAVLDIDMPQQDGFDVVRAIRHNRWPVETVFLTMHKDERFLNAALELEVKGYVLKDSAMTEIVDCIKQVASGGEYISPLLSTLLLRRIRNATGQSTTPSILQVLTPTERLVLRRIAAYKTSREIATELASSVRTVEHHRASIGQKLDLKGSHALLRFAVEHASEL